MKTFATLTAVAALVAGISIANAQGTTSPAPMGGAASQGQQQAIGTSPFCINTSASGSLNCKYASLAACEKDAKPQKLNCSPNPKSGTTGSKQ